MSTPKIDAYGNVTIDGKAQGGFRIIEISESQLALFSVTDPPLLLDLAGTYSVRARRLTATLVDGSKVEFTRASCGCQTPSGLKGVRSKFVAQLELSAVDA